ncbi:MAG: InlB B-repeat-containing protein [Erysipelotrichaceae bacterium]|nr:InlB B-repeat-containing protein [Erysipelotrichaceae bacterium]
MENENNSKKKRGLIILIVMLLLLASAFAVTKLLSKKQFEITVLESAHGKVEVDKLKAYEGDTVTIKAIPDEGYEVSSVLVNGKESEMIFTMPYENVTILVKFSLKDSTPEEIIGDTFGGVEGYMSSEGVDLSHDNGNNPYVTIIGGGEQFAYLNDVFDTKFYFETSINVKEIYNNDKYPKFGIIIDDELGSTLFYVDMNTKMTSNKVGVVHQQEGKDYDWKNAFEKEVSGMKFSDSDSVKLGIARNNNNYYFYVNDKLVLMDKDLNTKNAACGVFTFNTALKLDRYSKAVGDDANSKINKAVNDGLYLRGDFFGWYKNYRSSKEVKMIYDHGQNRKLVVDGNSPQYAYVNDIFTDKFSFTTTIDVNDILANDKAPKFGLMINNDKQMVKFYVDMNDKKEASQIGVVWQKNGANDDWAHALTERIANHNFTNKKQIELKVVRDKDQFYFFVDGVLFIADKGLTNNNAAVGVFSFNTNMTLSNYSIKVGDNANEDIANAKDQTKRLKGDFFGKANIYKTTISGVDLYNDHGTNPYTTFFGTAPQYAYVNDLYTNKFVFESDIEVKKVLNNDAAPKFGIMINGNSEMLKFFVDLKTDLTANEVGVVRQKTNQDDEWNSVLTNIVKLSFNENDTIKLKIIRNNLDYYFFVNDRLVIFEKNAITNEKSVVGLFSFNTEFKALNYSIKKGNEANNEINAAKTIANNIGDFTIGTNNFVDNGDGSYTFESNDQSLHKVDDIRYQYKTLNDKYKLVHLKLELVAADDWGQARVLVSKDPQNEMFVALEKKNNGKYQVFTMSKNNQNDFDNWELIIPELDENYIDLDIVTIGNEIFFLNDNQIIYKKTNLDANNAIIKVTGYNNARVIVSDISGKIFNDELEAREYINDLSVIVNYYDGNILIDNETLNINEKITKTDPSKEGYKFVSWYKDESLTVAFDKNEAVISELNLYAKWNKLEIVDGNEIEIEINNLLDNEIKLDIDKDTILYETVDKALLQLIQGHLVDNIDINAETANQIKEALDNEQALFVQIAVDAHKAELNDDENNIILLYDENSIVIASYEINIYMTIKADNNTLVDKAKINELDGEISINLNYPQAYDRNILTALDIHNNQVKELSIISKNTDNHSILVKSKEFSKYVITTGVSNFSLTTNYFEKTGSTYALTTNSKEETTLDEIKYFDEVVRGKYYRINGSISLDTEENWNQARIIISKDTNNEYVIALEKVADNAYQIFTMSKDNETLWNDWRLISHYEVNGNRHSIDFEVVVIEDKVYFLIDNEIAYVTKNRVDLSESTPKIGSYGTCTTTLTNLDGQIFNNKDEAESYINSINVKPYESRFENRINSLYQEYIVDHNCANNGGTLLFGDSNIDFWDNWQVQAGLTDYINGYNVGIGGSTTTDWLYAYEKLIKPFNADRIVFMLGFNDVFVWGEDGDDTVNRLYELMNKIHTDNPDAKIYCIYQTPCPAGHNGIEYTNQKYEQLVTLTEEMCDSLDYVTGISVFDLLKGKTNLFRLDNVHLNDEGYLVFSDYLYDLIFKGETFGVSKANNNSYRYKTTNGVEISNDNGSNPNIEFFGGSPQYAFVNDTYTDKLYFEAQFNVSEVLNNDAWPKFGLLLDGQSEMLKLFVDMTPSLTANNVGLVHQLTGKGDDWANAINKAVNNMKFTGDDNIKLSIIKNGKDVYAYVNDELVIFEENCSLNNLETVGAFSFNTRVTLSNYLLFKDDAALTYIQKAIDDHELLMNRNVTFKDGENVLNSLSIKVGNKINYQPEKDGYTFVGWYKDSQFTDAWDINNDVVTDNITLYAKFVIKNYIVNYYYDNQLIDSESVEHGSSITKLSYVKEGYSFDAWYKEATFVNKWSNDDPIDKNLDLYAKMNINSYSVTYMDGNDLLKEESLDYGSKISYLPNKDGAVFSTWYKDKDLTQIWSLDDDKVVGNITLYAKFVINQYQVKYYYDGNLIDNETVDYDSLITKSSYSKEGYSFVSWYKEASLINKWDNTEDRITADTSLYAKMDINKYTVSYYNGTTLLFSEEVEYDNLISHEDPSSLGYNFVSWYKDSALTIPFDKTNETIKNDTNLYAKFTNEGKFFGNVGENIASGANFIHDDNSDNAYVEMIGNNNEAYYPVAYVKDTLANKYIFEIEIEALDIYNNDNYPKFGVYFGGLKNSNYRFYVDVNKEIRSNIVGLYKESTDDYNFAKANVLMSFKDGDTVKLKAIRNINDLYIYVNDSLVIYQNDLLGNEDNYLGVYSFNMGLKLSNYSFKSSGIDEDISKAINDAETLESLRTISQVVSGKTISYDVEHLSDRIIVNARANDLSNFNLDLYFTANGREELQENNGYMAVIYRDGNINKTSYSENNKNFTNASNIDISVERSQNVISVSIPYSSLGISEKEAFDKFAFMPAIYNNSDATYHLFTESNPWVSKAYSETWYQCNLNGALAIDPIFEQRANGSLTDWTKPDFMQATVFYEAAIKEQTWQQCVVAIVCNEKHGANMFDLHIQELNEEDRSEENLRKIIHSTYKPVLAIFYNSNDLQYQGEILKTACKAGASAIDLPGYYYSAEARTQGYDDSDRQQWIDEGYSMSFASAAPSESTILHENVKKQNDYIAEIHALGSKVLLSEHVYTVFDKQQAIDYVTFMLKTKDIDVCKLVGRGSSKEDAYNCVEATKYLTTLVDNNEFPGKRFSYHLTPLAGGESGWLTRIINPAFFKSYVAFCYGDLGRGNLDYNQIDIDMGIETHGYAQTFLQAYLQNTSHSLTDLSIEDCISILDSYGENHHQYLRYRNYYLNSNSLSGRAYAKTGQHNDYWRLNGSSFVFNAKSPSTTNGYPVRGFAYDFDNRVKLGEDITIFADITSDLGTSAYTSSTRNTRTGLYLGNNESLLAYVYNTNTRKLELVYNNREFVVGDADALSTISGIDINNETYNADIINGDTISMSLSLQGRTLTLGFKDSTSEALTQVACIELSDELYALIGESDGFIKGGVIAETYVRSGAISEDKNIYFSNVSYNDVEYSSFFGDAGNSYSLGADFSHDDGSNERYVTIAGDGTNQTYVKSGLSNKFVFETEIEATSLNNGELYPKFGICLDEFNSRMKFYVDMKTDMTGNTVALWKDNTYNVSAKNVTMNFVDGNKVKLKIIRDVNDYYCYVNDQLVIYEYDNLVSENSSVGIFTYNTGLTLTNYSYLENGAANNAINQAKEDVYNIEANYEEINAENIISNAYKAYNYFLNNSDNGNAYQEVYRTSTASNIYAGEWIDATFQMGALDLYDYDKEKYNDIYTYVKGLADARNGLLNGGTNTGYLDALAYAQVFAKLNSYDSYDLENVKAQLNFAMNKIDNQYYDYSWIDEDYMVGWVNTYLSFILNDSSYTDADYRSYMKYRAEYFDESTGLWFRDANYIYGLGEKGTTNDGKKVLWSRGNAWVYVSLARHLSFMEENGLTDSAIYSQYKNDFITMSNSLVNIQRKDGFWNVNLSDSKLNTGKETTGTSGFLYGLSKGIKLGYLDNEKYMNAAINAYLGLSNKALTSQGKLVYCQPIGWDPFTYSSAVCQNNTTAFGVGLYISGCKAFAEVYEEPYSLQGNGSEANPYLITSLDDYNYIAEKITAGENYQDKYIKLTSDLGNIDNPITKSLGDYDNFFAGNFDGDNHTLYINLTNDRGLFNKIDNGSVIRNVVVDGSVNFSGNENYVGGIAAVAYSGSVIDNCENKASINGNVAGGIVGFSYGATITNCTNYGDVTGNVAYSTAVNSGNGAGGIVGTLGNTNPSIVSNCINLGNVTSNNQAGGIVGKARTNAETRITNCINNGTITVSDDSGNHGIVGGIVGMAGCKVDNCINNGEINGTSQVGGIAGALISEGKTDACHNYGQVNASKNYVGGIVGWAYQAVTANSITNSVQHGNSVTKTNTTYPTGLVRKPNYIGWITGQESTSGATAVSGENACAHESGE